MANEQGLDEYRRRHPQECANFENDTELSISDRRHFLDHLDSYSGSDYDDHLNQFFHAPSNKQLGSSVTLNSGELLGCVRATSSLASRFSAADGLDRDSTDAEEYIRELTFLSASQ